MPASLQTDKLGDIFHVLAEDVLIASRQDRHRPRTQFLKPFPRCGFVQDIQRGEVNALFRKKLFRSKTTASTGLGKENKFIGRNFHNVYLA
jgi:hypothetical protein